MAARTDVSADAAALAVRAAEWMTDRLAASSGPVAVALSGGSTPKALYRLLAKAPLKERMPWGRVHWFWGDDRFVPHDHPDSNVRMAREAFLDVVPVPPENIHPIAGTGTAAAAAASYEAELKRFHGTDTLSPNRPLFEIVLLGIGQDGHTASLFPGTAAIEERKRWVVPNRAEGTPHERVTLTFPPLASARAAAFLVAGADKREVLAGIMGGSSPAPAARMAALLGDRLTWFLDEAAAG